MRESEAADVLEKLVQPSNAAVHSSSGLVGNVMAAAVADDDKPRKKTESEPERLRRKPTLRPIFEARSSNSLRLTPWDVLHALGRGIALSRRGAGRGLAEHWGCLKYTQALTGSSGAFMALSAEGRETADYYKALQSKELGIGFALALAKQLLSRNYPEHFVSVVPADTVLRAGWALTSRDSGPRAGYRYRPQFFAEVWKPGGPSRVFPIACKGSHGGSSAPHVQLASASAHAEAVHIGAWNDTPAFLFSTELPVDGPLAVHALHAPGRGGKLRMATDAQERSPDQRIEQKNIVPGIQRPTAGKKSEQDRPEPGFHVQPEHYAWFGQVLARADAAALAAFTGDAATTSQYLTDRQGRRHFTEPVHAATDSVPDAHATLLGIPFVGTDHVFRLNRTRVEAFSGIATDIFQHLQKGRVEQFRSEIHSLRSNWPSTTWDSKWMGPVSVNDDGSVLAMRILRS